MTRSRNQDRINKGVMQGSQRDLFGNDVHMLNAKDIYREAKCGTCGHTVKLSRVKTHLSFGNKVSICLDCLEGEKSAKTKAKP